MILIKTLLLIGLTLTTFSALTTEQLMPYSMPRAHVVAIEDSKLNRQYELYIKLPEDYTADGSTQYPVIYTTDAKWQMDLLSGVTSFLMPTAILVGISWQTNMSEEIDYGKRRAYASRFRDYSFLESEKPDVQAKYQFGKADQHLRFIRDRVKKYVKNHYQIDVSNQTYLGYSMGAEFGAYIVLSQPDTFDNYILGSPSVDTRSVEFLEKQVTHQSVTKETHMANVFISIGELEDTAMKETNQLVSLFEREAASGLSLTGLKIIKAANHSTAVPDTFTQGIKWLAALSSR
ncbi:alpha/beta hydrolase [Alteromonas sp. ASW11-130]|uniref:alpha/beta hydrolase n=1 Tax=Alteromonas sp. ASW11-130 TaxID=3015775 RepID=UPI00224189E2|nr:alpha/beta hydrolase-fold protein [Alteromonas sp. ASW11-130]MCW8093287.1 alpha/beta hydrolase-fold protein [Alteromonas sp. ASW11-130]